MSEAFLGEIKAYGFPFAPRNFAFCNGATLSIAQNTALFSLLGTTYGGNGQTTFQLPNLGGRHAMGQGQSPGTSNYVMGQVAGAENITLTQLQMPMHTHTATTTVTPTYTSPSAATTINGINRPSARQSSPSGGVLTGAVDSVNQNVVDIFAAPTAGTVVSLDPSAATTSLTGGGVTAAATTQLSVAGGGQPFSVQSPYLVINYCICTSGLFPSRN